LVRNLLIWGWYTNNVHENLFKYPYLENANFRLLFHITKQFHDSINSNVERNNRKMKLHLHALNQISIFFAKINLLIYQIYFVSSSEIFKEEDITKYKYDFDEFNEFLEIKENMKDFIQKRGELLNLSCGHNCNLYKEEEEILLNILHYYEFN
jgi:hypothetical protein